MCAVRRSRSSDGTAIPPLARRVGQPRPCQPANDNLARTAGLDLVALFLAVCWRMTMGVCGLGMLGACACLFVVVPPHP